MAAATIDVTPKIRRLVQTISDLRRGSLRGCRVIDLGCAHGSFALEFARRGAHVIGLEGRQEWLDIANCSKESLALDGVEFVAGDVNEIDPEKLGSFDIVFCAGLLYHLDAPEVFEFTRNLFRLCTDFAVIDTHIALHGNRQEIWEGRQYNGISYLEHLQSASEKERLEAMGASLKNDWSYWMTKSSLFNLLHHVGFTSVLEIQNPYGHVYADGNISMHPDIVSLVAFKGAAITDFIGGSPEYMGRLEDWPEESSQNFVSRPHSHTQEPGRPDERSSVVTKAPKTTWWSRLTRRVTEI